MIGKIMGLIFLLCTQAHAAQTMAQRFSRDVVIEGQVQQTLLAVPLDAEVYADSASDFRDLRLIDNQQVETPFLLQKIAGSKTVTKRLPVHSKKPTLKKNGEDGIIITLELDPDEVANVDGLTVVTKQRDFEYAIQVQAAEDGENWQQLVDNTVIYDYSRFMTFGNRDIELPGNSYRYFKLIVAKAVDTQESALVELTRSLEQGQELQRKERIDLRNQPLHIDRIELWHEETETVAENEQRFDYPLAKFEVSRDDDKKVTLIEIDAQWLPLTGFELSIETPNFSRTVEVQVPVQQGVETRMATIANGNIEALHFKDFLREQTKLYFPEQRRQRYRLVIDDKDNPPLKLAGIKGLGPGYQLLFLPQSHRIYQLRYGASKVDMPQYDTAPIQELLRKGYQPVPARLDSEVKSIEVEEAFDFLQFLNSNTFLGLVIFVMVLVLGWSLYRVSKRISYSDQQSK